MPIDLFKPTTVSLEKPQPAPKSPQPGPKLKLDKIKITPEKILRAKTLARPQDLAEPQLSENGLLVLKKRYLKKDEEGKTIETAQDMFWRVASNISQAEQIYNPKANLAQTARQFYDLMASARFLPNSPTLRGAGREMQQLSACFCLPIEDSLDSIMTTLKNACHIFKTGGGCGYSFSRLRPRKDKISTTGNNAGGPVSFMRVYNAAIGEITQGGVRMGANMGMLRCDHPDIEEFIDSKTDMTSMTNFNISVSATDEFMDAIEQNRQYELINPRTKQATGSINARKVFDKICENAWRNGDPGMIFIDKINNSSSNPVKSLGLIEATNPCLTGDAWVTTKKGPSQIKNLVNYPGSLLFNGKFYSTTNKGFFPTGKKQIYEIQTNRGYRLTATANHQIKTLAGWKSVSQLKLGDKIVLSNNKNANWKGKGAFGEGYLLGVLLGDGTIKKDNAIISVWGNNQGARSVRQQTERFALSLPHRNDFQGFQTQIKTRREYRLKLKAIYFLAKKYALLIGNKKITTQIEMTGKPFHQGFLRGLFDTDGSVQGSQNKGVSIRLAQSNLNNLISVQRMLLRLGIASTIYQNRRLEGVKELPDGKGGKKTYSIKPQHELVISGNNLKTFYQQVSFADIEKKDKLITKLNQYKRSLNKEYFLSKITKITPQGIREVFDVQVPGTNAFSANGIIVHNCGEQPLLPNESCVLGSINLAKFVKEENLDWDELKKTVEQAIHFLDNVIDMNKYVLPEIERYTKGLRRTGLGVMGFADMLVQLGIGYSSAEGIEMAEKIMEFINSQAKETSQKLASERGAYPYFKKSIDFQKGELPLRNVARTTIAPTGTISVIADCSSGIEPIYALVHKRKSIWDKQRAEVEFLVVDKNFKALARQQGFDSPEVMEEISRTGSVTHNSQVPERIKRVFVTAHDLAPLDHIKIQAAFQRHTDNAISKTINFPHSATVDDVKEAYLTAYRLGCKGITIYRDGSRDTQVLTVGDQPQTATAGVPAQVEPRERPNVVMGSTEKISTGMGNLFVTINEDKEGLFEVFAQIGKSGGDAGALVEAIARLISIGLRSRVPTDIIIEQLKGIRGSNPVWQNGELILSPPDAIGKALERYLARQKELNLVWKNQKATEEKQQQEALEAKIEEKPVSAQKAGNICPECGDSLIYEEGCVKCPSCKFTKCG